MTKDSKAELWDQGIRDRARPSTRLVVTTEDLIDIWRCNVRADVGVRVPDGGSGRGGIRTGSLGGATVSSLRAGPHSVSARPISGGTAHMHFCLVTAGSAVLAQDGREAAVGPGDLVCFDSGRRFTLTMHERISLVAVRVPHALLRVRVTDTADVTARPWLDEPGLPAVVREALSGVSHHVEDLHDDIAELVGSSFVNLLGMLLAQRLDRQVGESGLARGELLRRVVEFGERNLDDVELTPRKLAQANHLSLRHLQQLFADKGTSPARWIREERLARCHADLRDPAKRHLSVAAIGERWGLPNPSHFSKQFRNHFAITPRELRTVLEAEAA